MASDIEKTISGRGASAAVLLVAGIGGLFLGGLWLVMPGFTTTIVALLIPMLLAPILTWFGRFLIERRPKIRPPIPGRLIGALLVAAITFAVATTALSVHEPRLRYHYNATIPHSATFRTFFSDLVSCGDAWYAFGSRNTMSEDAEKAEYVDAIVWKSTTPVGLNWSEPPWDPENRGGVFHESGSGLPNHREFYGAECHENTTVAYGWDTSGSRSGGDANGALWQQQGDNWQLLGPFQQFIGPGGEAVVGLAEIANEVPSAQPSSKPGEDADWRAFLSRGNSAGIQCFQARDLQDWHRIGGPQLTQWTVREVSHASGQFVALGTLLKDGVSTYSMFVSADCMSWEPVPLLPVFSRATTLVSVKFAHGWWFLTGWTHENGRSRPLLGFGRHLDSIRELSMDRLSRDLGQSNRGFYSLAENSGRLLVLAWDESQALMSDPNSIRDDLVFPLEIERANAISLPFLGTKYHSSYDPIDLAE